MIRGLNFGRDFLIGGFFLSFCLLASAGSVSTYSSGPVFSSSGVTFRVWAPNARSVRVVGDFNNWQGGARHDLKKNPTSGIWSGHIRSARDGSAYQFMMNGEFFRRDPYARAVTSDGKSSKLKFPDKYNWGMDAPLRQDMEDLVIYELHIGTFHDPNTKDGRPGTFHDAIKKLDRLVWLGVNAVCVMPVHEFHGLHSWGYNPSDIFAVEQAYGGPDGFREFVKACHAKGIAVHLDVVHNHYGPENLDLLMFDGTGGAKVGGIYFYDGPGISMTPWGPRVRFDDQQVRLFIRDNIRMWFDEFHIDGLRWDSTINIRAYNGGESSIPAGAGMLDEINDEIDQLYPGRLSIAEDSLDIGRFDGSWEYGFHHDIVPQISARADRDRNMYAIMGSLTRKFHMNRVVYTDNHDEAGKLNRQFRIATDIDPDKPEGDKARRLSGVASMLTLSSPGIPLLFMGNEMQETGTFHDDIPMDWGHWNKHAGLVRLHRDLIRLRRNLDGAGDALKGSECEVPHVDNVSKQMVYWRWHKNNGLDRMVFAVNLSRKAQELVIPFPSTGVWETYLNTDWKKYGGETPDIINGNFTLKEENVKVKVLLPPYSGRVFILEERPRADSTSIRTVKSSGRGVSKEDRDLYSFYESIYLTGTFNDWDPAAWKMKLVDDYMWERVVSFDRAREVSFKISANGAWKIKWGGPREMYVSPPYTGPITRTGEDIHIDGILDGNYLIRFDEKNLKAIIEQTDRQPSSDNSSGGRPIRTWRDKSGKALKARFVSFDGDRVMLEKADGSMLRIPLSKLSAADRRYVMNQRY